MRSSTQVSPGSAFAANTRGRSQERALRPSEPSERLLEPQGRRHQPGGIDLFDGQVHPIVELADWLVKLGAQDLHGSLAVAAEGREAGLALRQQVRRVVEPRSHVGGVDAVAAAGGLTDRARSP